MTLKYLLKKKLSCIIHIVMKISVIVPAYNEEKYIEKCLNSLLSQKEPADEIIVIDNNSTDKTAQIVKKMGIKIIIEKKQGMTFARNRGFESAKHEIIARCDADSIVPNDWIEKIKSNFKKYNIDALSGPVFFNDLSILKVTSGISSYLYYELLRMFSKGNGQLAGPNMSITKDIWKKVKNLVTLDDTKVHEDQDLSLKITKVHGKIKFDPMLIVGISARRLKNNPESFFIEYPIRVVKTFIKNNKDNNKGNGKIFKKFLKFR